MLRAGFAMTALIVLTAACQEGETPAAPVTPEASTETPAPAPPSIVAPEVLPGMRVAPMQLSCGGESFRVAFEDARAVIVNEDGSNTELAALTPSPDSEPGVTTFTNGMLTFAKSGGQDTPAEIRFARGRMAFQDCAIAVN